MSTFMETGRHLQQVARDHPALRSEELAERAGVTEETVRRYLNAGWLMWIQPGNGYNAFVVSDPWMQEAMGAWFHSNPAVINELAAYRDGTSQADWPRRHAAEQVMQAKAAELEASR